MRPLGKHAYRRAAVIEVLKNCRVGAAYVLMTSRRESNQNQVVDGYEGFP
jgi:hypothetical protein